MVSTEFAAKNSVSTAKDKYRAMYHAHVNQDGIVPISNFLMNILLK